MTILVMQNGMTADVTRKQRKIALDVRDQDYKREERKLHRIPYPINFPSCVPSLSSIKPLGKSQRFDIFS